MKRNGMRQVTGGIHTHYDFKLCQIKGINACTTACASAIHICLFFFPLIFNKCWKKYRTKWKAPTRGENCWCLQDLSWAVVRAVALPLLMIFPRLTPACKLQLRAGGSACSWGMASLCTLCICSCSAENIIYNGRQIKTRISQDESKILLPKLLVFWFPFMVILDI